MKNPGLGTAYSLMVYNPETRATILERNSGVARMPASNMKVFTGTVALDVLGADRRLPTRIVAGRTPGEIIVIGGGDPMLSSGDLRRAVSQVQRKLRAQKVRSVVVKVDESLFADFTPAKGWPASYVPEQVRIVRPLVRDDRAVRFPGADVGVYVASLLKSPGVKSRYAGGAKAPAGATELAVVPGHTVAQAVQVMLEESDNDYAEMLFRHIAIASGKPATWAGAQSAMLGHLGRLGVPTASLVINDGSGLSWADRVTPRALTMTLAAAMSRPSTSAIYAQPMLPIAGRTGTLAHNKRFQSKLTSCAQGFVYAKTGTVEHAITLSGYAIAADGAPRIFSVLLNGKKKTTKDRTLARTAVDTLAATITGCS